MSTSEKRIMGLLEVMRFNDPIDTPVAPGQEEAFTWDEPSIII